MSTVPDGAAGAPGLVAAGGVADGPVGWVGGAIGVAVVGGAAGGVCAAAGIVTAAATKKVRQRTRFINDMPASS